MGNEKPININKHQKTLIIAKQHNGPIGEYYNCTLAKRCNLKLRHKFVNPERTKSGSYHTLRNYQENSIYFIQCKHSILDSFSTESHFTSSSFMRQS